MAANLNEVFLMGNLTADPELKQTPRGTAVCDLRMAINDTYKAQDGTTKEVVTYVDVEVWGRTAENCKQYLSKGRGVFVKGQLKLDQWEQDGQKRSKLKVRGVSVQFLGGGQGGGGGGGGQGGGSRSGGNYSSNEQRPATSTGRTSAPAPSVSEDAPPVRDEDDIPF
jgi:single-strand DNA-binding protein